MKLIKVWSFQLLRLSVILIQLLEAFEDFLSTFKTSPTANITHALGGMNIDEDDFSDDNDMMDDDDDDQTSRRQTRAQAKVPKLKYLELLQKVADRYEDEITIELDDLAKVQRPPLHLFDILTVVV